MVEGLKVGGAMRTMRTLLTMLIFRNLYANWNKPNMHKPHTLVHRSDLQSTVCNYMTSPRRRMRSDKALSDDR